MSLSFCILGDLAWIKLLPFSLAQIFGAYLASGLVYLIYHGKIKKREMRNVFLKDASCFFAMISHSILASFNVFEHDFSTLFQMQLWSSVVEF